MRQTLLQQLPLVPSNDHAHGRDLASMSRVLDELPESVLISVRSDLRQKARADRGRKGMAAEQVLRVMVLKQLTGLGYARLAFLIDDSLSYRAFCRFGPGERTPRKSTLQQNVKLLRPETLEQLHDEVVKVGLKLGVEDGQRVGVDSTAIKADIHHPTDSSLLRDCVEKLTSLLWSATEVVGLYFSDHRKRARRRALEIANAKSMEKRVPLYKDLLRVVGFSLKYAEDAVLELNKQSGSKSTKACAFAKRLRHYIELVRTVGDQTYRRVVLGEKLPPSDKLVSIFEPHADIIIKDNRGTTYGHKAFVTVGASGLVLDLDLPRGNPADITRAKSMIAALKNKHNLTPTEAAFDGGFCTHANLAALKTSGVKAVAFTSPRGLTIKRMTGTRKRFEALRRFRASIEGTIGWLKNALGLARCTWRGYASYQCYAWASALTLNLLVIGRQLPAG
jgi:IS5 family transposase